MADDEELIAFIRGHIASVWTLELLLLLKRDPCQGWSPGALVAELRGSTALVANGLRRLEQAGITVADEAGDYRYTPASPVLHRLCDRLDAEYKLRPVTMTTLIASPPDKLQILADAFKLKKPGK